MTAVRIIDRISGEEETEEVYGELALRFLYGSGILSKTVGALLLHSLIRFPFVSSLFGRLQKLPMSKRKILPFIQRFKIDPSEFLDPIENFTSFNDFFIRKLRPEARPIASDNNIAIIPADGRYLFRQNITKCDSFYVKGEKLDLTSLLKNTQLAKHYEQGSMVIGRLCPTDYHRFHFPCDGVPGPSQLINGWLYSVNPIALKKGIDILTKNKRSICKITTKHFGTVLYIEVGATNVGSINQTYTPHRSIAKGEEKGFFSFGGSTIILLFEPKTVQFTEDLIELNKKNLEVRCLMGQPMCFSVKYPG